MSKAVRTMLIAGLLIMASGFGLWVTKGESPVSGRKGGTTDVVLILDVGFLLLCAAYIVNRRDKYLKKKFRGK